MKVFLHEAHRGLTNTHSPAPSVFLLTQWPADDESVWTVLEIRRHLTYFCSDVSSWTDIWGVSTRSSAALSLPPLNNQHVEETGSPRGALAFPLRLTHSPSPAADSVSVRRLTRVKIQNYTRINRQIVLNRNDLQLSVDDELGFLVRIRATRGLFKLIKNEEEGREWLHPLCVR